MACLDRPAADAVLEQLTPEQAQRVRQAVVVLDEIPDNEQQHVVDEFFRLGPQKTSANRLEWNWAAGWPGQIDLKRSAHCE